MPKETYLVTLNRPASISIMEMADYIERAVEVDAGCRMLPDPFVDDFDRKATVQKATNKRLLTLIRS